MHDPVDVLIIGAGASGAAVAWSLADTRMHILCLEQGGWMNPATYPSTGRNWEARAFGDYSPSPNIRARPEDYPINDDNSPIKVVNFNGVGGGTMMYTAHFPRLHPSDFRVRSLDGVAEDWPVDYDTLVPFFEENDRMMGVSGLAGDPGVPPRKPPMPPLPLGRFGARLATAMNRLGWHWWPSDTTVATVDYEGRARCINLGHCTPACAQGAKGSTDITYWPVAQRAGVELRTHCRVREITTDEQGMAAGVVNYDAGGIEQFQAAHVVVLACNGVGTPRLLLNSASGRFPNGLANSSGLVGKNLMFHPMPRSMGMSMRPPTATGRCRPACGARSTMKPIRRAALFAATRFSSAVASGRSPRPSPARRRDCCRGAQAITPPSRRLNGHRPGLSAICEDLPEEHNRVTLDPVLRDSHGIPAPRIDYRIGENTARMIARAKEILAAAEATDICVNSPILYGGWHLLGTARMGVDPTRSVVNEWGRSHDVKNLFIVDGSLFVTSGGVNPTSTIQALALYIADQMKQRLANLFD
jgi:choline dehydrogenase-like flavoprotein